jgi:hypothetical protein
MPHFKILARKNKIIACKPLKDRYNGRCKKIRNSLGGVKKLTYR